VHQVHLIVTINMGGPVERIKLNRKEIFRSDPMHFSFFSFTFLPSRFSPQVSVLPQVVSAGRVFWERRQPLPLYVRPFTFFDLFFIKMRS